MELTWALPYRHLSQIDKTFLFFHFIIYSSIHKHNDNAQAINKDRSGPTSGSPLSNSVQFHINIYSQWHELFIHQTHKWSILELDQNN